MSNPNSLYGIPRSKSTSQSQSNSPSSSTLAFTTALSSLINKDANASTRGRPRPSKTTKSDIFAHPNKGAQKRAAADLRDDDTHQTHQRSQDIGGVDTATLHRSKRRMEEKARMYEDLKKGLYLAAGSDSEEEETQDEYLARLRRREKEGLVDFDQKWADAQRGKGSGSDGEEEEEEDDDDDGNASIVSYEDELGRTRRGTRADAARAARLKEEATEQGDAKERWRPSRPDNLIYGAAVQAEAFNPDAGLAAQMSYLAKRRDRSPTPEETHYDADAEVRNRGTGFYAFSKDENVRRQQMEELMNARDETQREREVHRARKAERERVKDERRKKIGELRSKRQAEIFLAKLGDVGV
ncbi:hypothetical protein ANOM_003888 [Aspergillus nomiae NRRL 13137]|uniref:Coiled-coil domain-containing protein n=1 Tax=Aspergillus nomiae NRRL (strain ATCC 15546 / NRRL 13137 / CBS 260.88 / M93) TaxID=1509407 RepID=A0A0L1J8F5_ASPN3|nr:uncharacterized protein ANOM_003888 [Aspergillus nomiae NRRL 13137]KNG87703.1 hypothetical protein ANOM_003888 [Aspergillus nomiae NRRL 13137]